jgi:deazaflavin-dependent oxidoreductase (nitroreductase family)
VVPLGPQDYSANRAYRPPSRTDARLNRWVGVPLARWGWVPGDVASLEVPGRRSGRVRAVPVVVTRHAGGEYLVALAGESQWVRNVRAAHGVAVLRRRRRARRVRLEELPTPERPAVIAAYLDQGRRRGGQATEDSQARSYFGVEPGASQRDIAGVADRYPVFRVHDLG